jgi:hypothetical protein
MADQILVPFRGEGAGSDDLTWAQRSIWESMRVSGRSMAIGGTVALPQSTTVDEAAMVLRFVVSRHQSLRTRLTFDADGVPRQVLVSSGEVPLTVVDAADDDEPAAVAESLRARYELATFDYASEFPVWMTVVRHRGLVTHAVAMYSHLAIDGHGFAALLADLANLDRATGAWTAPVPGIQPLELVKEQRNPSARRQSDAALRLWERLLRGLPARRFADPGGGCEPRYWELDGHSPAMYLAVRLIAARTQVDSGHVLLAAYATALGRVTGLSPSVAQIVVNNRFRPGFADTVSHVTQYGLAAIDVSTGSFDDIVARAWKASVAANLSGYYDAASHQQLIARVRDERGEDVVTDLFFNDRRLASRQPATTEAPTPDAIRALRPLTTLRPGRRWDWYDGVFFVHINDVPDTIDFTIWADTRCLPPAGMEEFARQFEAVAIEAALAVPHQSAGGSP